MQLCKTFCEPRSYHERPHIYADNPPKAELRLALGKDKALAGAEHPKALNALYVMAGTLAQACSCAVSDKLDVASRRYFMYAFACLVERAWRFGLPLIPMDIPGIH